MKKKVKVEVCVGSSCFSKGSGEIVKILEKIDNHINMDIRGCLCQGKCQVGPIVIINGKEYSKVSKEGIITILKSEYGIQ